MTIRPEPGILDSAKRVIPGRLNQLLAAIIAALNAGGTGGTGTVTNTAGALSAFATVVGNGGADAYTPSGVGTAGQVWTSNGPTAAPTMQTAASGGISIGLALQLPSIPPYIG